MTEIKLTKRYPNSRTEDITDAYMRGWNDALDAVQNGKFHIADAPQTESTGSPIGDYRDGVGAWQTERMTEEEIDTMLAKVLVGQTDCEACELNGKADVCKICRASNYEPQTDCGWK